MYSRVIKRPSSLVVEKVDNIINFKGKLGVSRLFLNRDINVVISDNDFKLTTKIKKFIKLYFQLINNHIFGVMYGFNRKIRLVGVGYIFETVPGFLILSIGYSHKVYIKIPYNISVIIKKKRYLFVTGNNLEDVTCFVALIRNFKSPDCYKGKGVLYQRERVELKIGKRT